MTRGAGFLSKVVRKRSSLALSASSAALRSVMSMTEATMHGSPSMSIRAQDMSPVSSSPVFFRSLTSSLSNRPSA